MRACHLGCLLIALSSMWGCAGEYGNPSQTAPASSAAPSAAANSNEAGAISESQIIGEWQLDLAASTLRYPNGPAATGMMASTRGLPPDKVRQALSMMTFTFQENGVVTVRTASPDGSRQSASDAQWSLEGGKVIITTPNGGKQPMRIDGGYLVDDTAFAFVRSSE